LKKSSKKDDSFDIIKGNPVLAKELITAMNPSFEKDFDGENGKDLIMQTFLSYAVPAHYIKLKNKDKNYVDMRRKSITTLIASKGDVLLFGGKEKGEAAAIFEEFSEGVCILAMLAKGGVDIFGKKWDYPCPDNW